MKGLLTCRVTRKELDRAWKEGRRPVSTYKFEPRDDIEIDYDPLVKLIGDAFIKDMEKEDKSCGQEQEKS